MSFKKQNFIDPKQRSHMLMGKMPIWLSMLKLGSSGLAISFLTALFLFIAQIMIVNFLPQTVAFSFNHLFIWHKQIFNALTSRPLNEGLIKAIGNSTALGVFTTSDVARGAISLVAGELFLVQIFPSVMIAGAGIYYAKALGINRLDKAKEVWQSSVIAVSLIALAGFVIMIVLTPLITPLQAVKTNLTTQKYSALSNEVQQHLTTLGWQAAYLKNNILQILFYKKNYYLPIYDHGVLRYLSVTNLSILNSDVLVKNVVFSKANLISVNLNNLLPIWRNYFATVRSYSVQWAEEFLFIMSLSLITQCFGGMLSAFLRTDGELRWTTIVSVISVCLCVLFNWILVYLAQLGLAGSAIASFISFFMQLVCYSLLLQFHPNSHLKLQHLKKMHVQWSLAGRIVWSSANKFLSSIGNMILLIILTNQLTYVSNVLLATSGSEYFIAILGGVIPFISLFTSTLTGSTKNVIQVFSYNYTQKNYKRYYECFWTTFIYGLIVGVILFLLFGLCAPIKVGVLNWFHITALSPNNELASSLRLMLIWMIEIPCLAFMLDSAIIFLVMGDVKLAFLNSAWRTLIVPIPVIFIFSTIATHQAVMLGESVLPYENNAMWFFIDVGPVYVATFCGSVFLYSVIYLYVKVKKQELALKRIKQIKVITN